MSHVREELDRVSRALAEPQSVARFNQLYVAQQALAWAMEPQGFASPIDVIEKNAVGVSAKLDTQAAAADCFRQSDPHGS